MNMNELTTYRRVVSEVTGTHLVKKFCAFYGTQRSITMFTRAWHWTLFRWIQSIFSHTIYL